MAFPKPIIALHQIELSSICDLACRYCPSPVLQRPKVHMTLEHLDAALKHVRYFVERGSQSEVNATGIGESTIHPEFVECVRRIRAAIGKHVRITIPTNGISLTAEMVNAVKLYNPRFWVSLHQPTRAAAGIHLLKEAGLLENCTMDPAVNPNDWAGAVDLGKALKLPQAGVLPLQTIACPWLNYGWAMVMADGRVSTCCLDASGVGVVGHVEDALGSLKVKPYSLCTGCYQRVDDPSWDQKAGAPRGGA